MKIIVGLGNPGMEYLLTRHNIGFMVIDHLAVELGINVEKKLAKSLIGEGRLKGEKVTLVKPQTYMNASGEALRALVDWFKADLSDILVIYDDMSLDLGRIRIRGKGSAGGHNGIKSIIQCLGTEEFPRLRIGISRPLFGDTINFVLGRFNTEEEPVIKRAIITAGQAVEVFVEEGLEKAMNKFN